MNGHRITALAGLLTLGLASAGLAQAPNSNNAAQNNRDARNAPPANVNADNRDERNAAAAKANGDHDHGLMVGHALGMVLEGSSLQLMARDIAGNDSDHLDKSKACAERVAALQKDARQNFEDADRLLRDTFNDVRDEQRSHTWRFYNAAAKYTKTLYALIGEPLAKPESDREASNAAARGEQGKLTPADFASILLINHTVKESMDACSLRKMMASHSDASGACEKLKEHARQMDANSLRCIEKIASSESNGQPAAAPADKGAVCVGQLAQNARDLIQVIQETHHHDRQPQR